MGNVEEVKAYGEEKSVTISSDEAAEYIIKVEVKDLSGQVKSDSISFTWKEENVQPPQTLPSQTAPNQTIPSSNHTSSNADPSNSESENRNFGSESTENESKNQSQESTKSFENNKSQTSKAETEKQTKPQKNETTKVSDDVKSETKEDKTKIPSINESQTKADKKESQTSSSETKTDKNESRTKSNKSETLDKIGNNETLKSYQSRGASSSKGNSSSGRVISVAKNTKNNITNRKLAAKTKTNLWFYDEKGWSADEIGGNSIRETWKELEWQGKLNWYYFGKDGYMLTGWQWINGKCYLLDIKTGMLYVNTTTPDGYKVNANGEWLENGVVQIK